MTLLTDVLDRVARSVSVEPPPSWVTATELEHVEIRDDFMLEAADEILERLDLPAPNGSQVEIIGTGVDQYSLPTDFKRIKRTTMSVYESTTVRRALIPVVSDGDWTNLLNVGSTGGNRYYRVEGYSENWSIKFFRPLGVGDKVTLSYVNVNWVAALNGSFKDAFTDAEDRTTFPRRLIETGTIWRWRERKGLNPTAALSQFETELFRMGNDRNGRKVLDFNENTSMRAPWDIPVPDFIPSGQN